MAAIRFGMNPDELWRALKEACEPSGAEETSWAVKLFWVAVVMAIFLER